MISTETVVQLQEVFYYIYYREGTPFQPPPGDTVSAYRGGHRFSVENWLYTSVFPLYVRGAASLLGGSESAIDGQVAGPD